MSKRSATFVLLAFLALATGSIMGSHTNIVGINTSTIPLFNGATMAYNTPITSSTDGSIGRSNAQSVQFRILGSTHATTVTCQTSLDEVNFATPLTGATVATGITDNLWHSAILSVPVCKAINFQATDNTTPTNSPSITLIFGAQ